MLGCSAEIGSVRDVGTWFRGQGLAFATRWQHSVAIRWNALARNLVTKVLANPVSTVLYKFGKPPRGCKLRRDGPVLQQVVTVPPTPQWRVPLQDHREG